MVDRKIFLTSKLRTKGRNRAELRARAFWVGNEQLKAEGRTVKDEVGEVLMSRSRGASGDFVSSSDYKLNAVKNQDRL